MGRAGPETAAESSGWRRTSTSGEVSRFLEALKRAGLPRSRELRTEVFGKSEEGRDLVLVRFGPAGGGRLKVLVNANIHAGEVEGKEAVQILLRELCGGAHRQWADRLELLFVPVYNPDGNDRIDRKERNTQNGPVEGVGTRENAEGLDLNRDFLKLASAEARALVALLAREDPRVFMDLHTTDGSYHGFHLTYAPSLAVNVDPSLDRFERGRLLPSVREAMLERHGFHVYDYGNYKKGRDPKSGWATYDHRPRFGTNYYGLRNRLSILSEAYSHLDFETRVRVTRAFVIECLRACAREAREIRSLCAAADRRAEKRGIESFRFDSRLEPPRMDTILTGKVERIRRPDGRYTIADMDVHEALEVPVQTAFLAGRGIPYPKAWCLTDPPAAVLEVLRLHGLRFEVLPRGRRCRVEVFEIHGLRRARRLYQGHHELRLEGGYVERGIEVPAGAVLIPADQPLARVAAQLLEPVSEDSLYTWEFFEVRKGGEAPTLRILDDR